MGRKRERREGSDSSHWSDGALLELDRPRAKGPRGHAEAQGGTSALDPSLAFQLDAEPEPTGIGLPFASTATIVTSASVT
jgi:hypothetical protein